MAKLRQVRSDVRKLGTAALISLTITCAIAGCSPSNHDATSLSASDFSEGSFLDSEEYIKEESRLTFVLLQPDRTINVDVSGMEVDFQCIDKILWQATSSLRTSLIRNRCATLLPGQGSAEEQAVQAEVSAAQEPSSGPSLPPTEQEQDSTAFSFFDLFVDLQAFVAQEYKWIITVALSLVGLAIFTEYRLSKKVKVILAGAPAAGKTDFWTALRVGSQPDSNSSPTVGQRTDFLEPVPLGNYKLHPSAVDIAGSQPELVLDGLGSTLRISRWKRKIVLVIVVSPTPGNASDSNLAFDEAFIERQSGYMSFPTALIRTRKKAKRPHAVVLFVSKFDLLSPHSPSDSAAEQTRDKVQARFDEHRQAIAGACQEKEIPFEFVIGSSKKGWGIEEAKKALWRGVMK